MAEPTNILHLEHEVLPLFTHRRSPRAYADKAVPAAVLHQIFAAGSSAASCFGEQPWRYLAASKEQQPDAYEKLLNALAPFNQVWAKNAPVLVIGLAKLTFSHDGNPNNWAKYDVGQSTATLALEAAELGLQIHQLAGFSPDAVRTAFQVPADFEPVVAFTLGYPGPAASLPDPLREREVAPRSRKPVGEILFEGAWPSVESEDYSTAQK